jgi:ribosomal protein L12E/L44/L45/RPP1/RPP2
MSAGKDKRPLGCGAKCKAKIDSQSNFIDYTEDEMIFLEDNPDYLFSNAIEPATLTALIGTGGAVLGAMATAIAKTKMTKAEAEANKEGAEAQSEYLKKQEEEKSKRTKTLIIGASLLSVVIIGGLFILRKRRKNK